MLIYFSGIGGAGIGPLALIAKQAGFEVVGSDKQSSSYIDYLKKHGITDIHIGQTKDNIEKVHNKTPIDWFVYSSAIEKENANAPELQFVDSQGIKKTKRDEFINLILKEKKLKMIAVAGTHGKTTTTAMLVWLFKQLDIPISYSVGAKMSFGDMGQYEKDSEYFVYEADEFDRNFLSFEPQMSLITGVSWDHHEIFPSREDYQQAFREFIEQSRHTLLWFDDLEYLNFNPVHVSVFDAHDYEINKVQLQGRYNRMDAWLAVQAVHEITGKSVEKLVEIVGKFPGLQRRMEEVIPGLYSDYAHTPEKVRGAMSVALEMASASNKDVVVVFEPLHNRRQHYMIDEYKDCFSGAKKLYWIPSYLAREDPNQRIIPPSEMIEHLSDPSIAEPMERSAKLKDLINKHLKSGDMVVCMTGGGGDSLDEWIRKEFVK